MSKKYLIPAGLVAVVIVLLVLLGDNTSESEENILVMAEQGDFVVDINTTGELEAKNSVKILGPSGLRRHQIYEVNLQSIIDEGTIVKKGDYVGSLDPSPITTKLQDAQIELEQAQSQYTQTKLETTLQMKEARNELINLGYNVDQKKLEFEQSEYEPPAVIRQKEIEYEKAKRALEQAKENLYIKKRQNAAKMSDVSAELRKVNLKLDGLKELSREFTIKAPEDGMLIYYSRWGRTVKAGSQINAWDPVVATLPDLSTMLSNTYVNEVDIRNVKKGQVVTIGLDAFPEKKLTGKVVNVANVGEQRPNSDAKVFLVKVEVNEQDELLRPGMTTSNNIITGQYSNVTYIPLECLNNQGDSLVYVYKSDGFGTVKQEVALGAANATDVIITQGLTEGDRVYMSEVKAARDQEVQRLDNRISVN